MRFLEKWCRQSSFTQRWPRLQGFLTASCMLIVRSSAATFHAKDRLWHALTLPQTVELA
jgi:hypothetical protein